MKSIQIALPHNVEIERPIMVLPSSEQASFSDYKTALSSMWPSASALTNRGNTSNTILTTKMWLYGYFYDGVSKLSVSWVKNKLGTKQ